MTGIRVQLCLPASKIVNTTTFQLVNHDVGPLSKLLLKAVVFHRIIIIIQNGRLTTHQVGRDHIYCTANTAIVNNLRTLKKNGNIIQASSENMLRRCVK